MAEHEERIATHHRLLSRESEIEHLKLLLSQLRRMQFGRKTEKLQRQYADHLPLYRQCEIYGREGVELERSTLADWVGGTSELLDPLVEALRRYVMAAGKLHADDTPVPVLAPGNGKTKTGRLWTYVRDDRPAGDTAAAAVWFAYSPDRKGEHPEQHLRRFRDALQADAYAGFNQLYKEDGRIQEVAVGRTCGASSKWGP